MLLGKTDSLLIATSLSILLYVLLNFIRAIAEMGMGFLSDYVNRRILLAIFGFGLFSVINIALLFTTTQITLWIGIFIGAVVYNLYRLFLMTGLDLKGSSLAYYHMKHENHYVENN